ncbi:hypothetical protein L873DRAFT_1831533 [Choiromyces venosus 120613-1]|uniref:Uncharacterized protein n=1 Tax=Choiromyces venosus 120613-1 TaxID=1336337 RepID=A0A3N4IXT8_9PEZI|nr:hypothetical protein L873DRAFT_1831533 [Choiromyces venosus 120613-1]
MIAVLFKNILGVPVYILACGWSGKWGYPLLSVIEPCTFSIPQPQHGLCPGYMVDLKKIGDEAFPDPEFEEGKEEQVFDVLEVMWNLPCGMNQLLVHQEFETIKCELLMIMSKKWTNVNPETKMAVMGLKLDYQIAGQLGSGKSFFLSYLLVLRILEGSETDTYSLFHLPENQKKALWILTDEKLENAGCNEKGHSLFVVQVASPKKVHKSWQWEKDRNVGSRYMSNWGWGEIVAAFRTCLESISMRNDNAYNRDLKTYLGHVYREIDTFILQEGYLTVEGTVHQKALHRIAIMDLSDDGWVFEKAQMKSQLNSFKLYKQLTRQDPLRSMAGWFFEGYAHDWFRKGGSFEADKLPVKNNNTHLTFMTNQSKSFNYFTNANELVKQVQVKGGQRIERDARGKYFLPYNTNFESVDGLVFSAFNTLILLQITITNSHPIKIRVVKNLYKSLPATIKNINIVFVIPEDRISEYSSARSAPEAGDVKPGAMDLTINQFQLVLTEETIHSMAVDGPFKVQDGGRDADESGSRDYDGGDTAMGGTQ